MAIDLGDPLPNLSVQTRNAAGVLENAGSVVLTLTLPDLTTTTPTVSNPSPGVYEATYVTVQAGRHLARWIATGANMSAYTDAYVVSPADPGMAFDLATAKQFLNEQRTDQDEEIRDYVIVATAIVEKLAGAKIAPRTIADERVRSGSWSLKLQKTPIMSVTSITSIRTPSSTWGSADLDVDKNFGYVYLLSGASFTNGPWTAVYQVGNTNPDSTQVHAVKEQLWHMWAKQRGQTADSIEPDLIDVADYESRGGGVSSFGFLVPRDVQQMLELDQVPGVA